MKLWYTSVNRSDWLNYKQNRYNLCVRHLQVKVKSYGQRTYLSKKKTKKKKKKKKKQKKTKKNDEIF